MQASFTRTSAVAVIPPQATTSGRAAPGQSSTAVSGPYPHFRFSSALSGFRLPQVNNFVVDSHRAQSKLVCFAVPASVPESANETAISLKPLPRAVENVADDPSLHNPLQRLHRLGPGWFGVILEYEGVLVEDTSDLHSKAWQMLGDEEGKPRPFNWALKRAEGMKSEQVHLLLASVVPNKQILSYGCCGSTQSWQYVGFNSGYHDCFLMRADSSRGVLLVTQPDGGAEIDCQEGGNLQAIARR